MDDEDKKNRCWTGQRKDGSRYVWCDGDEGKRAKLSNHCNSVRDPMARDACHTMEELRKKMKERDEAWKSTQARCPASPPRKNASWKPYAGDSRVFHCGFEGYLENRHPTPEAPTAECFYDARGRLVDGQHPYAGCKGTADQYPASDPRHTFTDRGGIAVQGLDAFLESIGYGINRK